MKFENIKIFHFVLCTVFDILDTHLIKKESKELKSHTNVILAIELSIKVFT